MKEEKGEEGGGEWSRGSSRKVDREEEKGGGD